MSAMKDAIAELLDYADNLGETGTVNLADVGKAAQQYMPGLLPDEPDGWLLAELREAYTTGANRAADYEAATRARMASPEFARAWLAEVIPVHGKPVRTCAHELGLSDAQQRDAAVELLTHVADLLDGFTTD